MKQLEWSDNTCTVGFTNIWAIMSLADMQMLMDSANDGWFSITSYEPKFNGRTPAIQVMQRHFPEREFGFYFAFRRDDKGETLLVRLRLQGMPDKSIGNHREPHERQPA